VDINAEGNKKTAQDVVKLGGKSREYTCDVADSKAVAELAIKAGPVDILVNNAGIICLESLLESSEATITEVINVNVTSQFLVSVSLSYIHKTVVIIYTSHLKIKGQLSS
jgi:NAD(P)-dependent dehydrogenase (short-subunit alcohol dehydrogenase family)